MGKGKRQLLRNVAAVYKARDNSAREIKGTHTKKLYIGCYVLWHTNMN